MDDNYKCMRLTELLEEKDKLETNIKTVNQLIDDKRKNIIKTIVQEDDGEY